MKRLFYWLSAAFSVFVNGCLDGWKGSIGSGITSGGLIHAETTLPEWQKIAVTVGGIAAPLVSHGLTDVAIWRASHPFPNLFPEPMPPITKTWATPQQIERIARGEPVTIPPVSSNQQQ